MARARFFDNRRGQRIAYVEEGDGPFLVVPPKWVSHIELEAEEPSYARFFGALAARFRVVRYDRVGTGLSERRPVAYTLAAEVDDLDALLDRIGAGRAHLLGGSMASLVVLACAAAHPERVDKVVVFNGFLDGAALATADMRRALTGLVRASWGLGSRALADLFYPDADVEAHQHFKALQRASADGATAARLLDFCYDLDARPFAARVAAPVLVLHRREDRAMPVGEGRRLAAALPRAAFVPLEGACHMPWHGDQAAVLRAILEFLDGGEPRRADPLDALLSRVAHAPSRAPEPTALLHYRILAKLGQGGMGRVYKAEDGKLGRVVALKRLAVSAGDDATTTARARLRREARAAAALKHPGIVTIFAIEEVGGADFIVMEYVEGESLDAAIRRGPLPAARVRAVGAEVAEALDHAHAAGLVHRDVKPANIMITPDGHAKVLDFGIAKLADKPAAADLATTLTAAGAIVGTGPYMSPEQLRGDALDARSDVFSLGCVLYEMASGRRAFPGANLIELVQQIGSTDPPPPSALVPSLPRALDAVVLRALSKRAADRFAAAADLAAALRAAT